LEWRGPDGLVAMGNIWAPVLETSATTALILNSSGAIDSPGLLVSVAYYTEA
jgi:hypothetical protein